MWHRGLRREKENAIRKAVKRKINREEETITTEIATMEMEKTKGMLKDILELYKEEILRKRS